ncbi:MAG: Tripartite tricarboxylate transporter TctB family protein [Chloroflexi bacterium]|jgi:hypothetical protein|nr:MAG: Tripartite tricarboxylate transporter TctB family protein [Chloroflexota bacterium]
MTQRFSPRILVTLFFLGAGVYAVFVARDWPDNVRLFPWLSGFGLIFMSLVQLFTELRKPVTKVMDSELAEGIDPKVAQRRVANIAGWLLGFAIAIWLLGFHIAIPLMVFGYLRFQGRESLILSIGLAAVTSVFFWGIFDQLLHLPFPQARIYLWFT